MVRWRKTNKGGGEGFYILKASTQSMDRVQFFKMEFPLLKTKVGTFDVPGFHISHLISLVQEEWDIVASTHLAECNLKMLSTLPVKLKPFFYD